MRRSLSLSLDEFGASALEQEAARLSVSPTELGSRAARYYLADRESGRVALRVPRLSREAEGKRELQMSIDLELDSWRDLESEATRQDVSVEALLEHAILYFLADLDSGKVERKMLEDDSA